MAIVDSKSSPANGTLFNANADCHIFFTWTNESTKWVSIRFRYASAVSKVYVRCSPDVADDPLLLLYYDGTENEVTRVNGIFTAEQEYRVDIYGNGSNIKIDVDGINKIDETVTYNQTQTGGRVDHNLATNDIELESWPYGEPAGGAIDLVPADLDHKTSLPGGGDGLWEIGAYIYDGGIENPFVPQVIRQLALNDLDHALALGEPSVSVDTPTQLVVADLDHVLSLGEPAVASIRALVLNDLDHVLRFSEPSVSVYTPTQLVVADLDHVLSLGEPAVSVDTPTQLVDDDYNLIWFMRSDRR